MVRREYRNQRNHCHNRVRRNDANDLHPPQIHRRRSRIRRPNRSSSKSNTDPIAHPSRRDRIFWPTSGERFEAYAAKARKRRAERPGYFRRAASFSVRRPVLVIGLALIISIPATYISLTESTSYDFAAGLPQAESVKGITALEQSFGAGQIGPTQVLVQFPVPILVNGNLTTSAQTSLEKLSQNITRLSNVKEVTGPTRPNGIPVNATNMASLTPEERQTILGSIGKDYRTAMLTILFAEEPFTQNSLNTVTQIRRLITSLQSS